MKEKVFVFEFDETLTYWDPKRRQYVPRPYMQQLLKLIKSLGHISIYNNTANILDSLFILMYLDFFDTEKVHTLSPNSLSYKGYEVVHITTTYCTQCTYDNIAVLPIKSHLLCILGDSMDNELKLLSSYINLKFRNTDNIKELNFNDWYDRVLIDNTHIKSHSHEHC